jgi:hypothetical protein
MTMISVEVISRTSWRFELSAFSYQLSAGRDQRRVTVFSVEVPGGF